MNIDELVKRISKTDGLSKTLGMHFISTPESDTLQASMKVDERNRQPFGFLSGGASLALAENVAGIGSLALCPGQIAVGINVSGTHVQAVSEGDTVTAYAKLVHKGRTLHTWEVAIKETTSSRNRSSKGTLYHKIKQGDTLGGIAAKYHVSISQLRNLNGIKGNNIRAGRSLRIR